MCLDMMLTKPAEFCRPSAQVAWLTQGYCSGTRKCKRLDQATHCGHGKPEPFRHILGRVYVKPCKTVMMNGKIYTLLRIIMVITRAMQHKIAVKKIPASTVT